MNTITLLNEKGGVGKTTLAVHIAAGLAVIGLRVVLVDADPQANATLGLGLPPSPGLYDLLVRDAKWRDTLRIVSPEVYEHRVHSRPGGMLAVLPSNVETRSIANLVRDALSVRKRLAELRDSVDYIIIDTSPTPSLLHGAISLATDYVLYPAIMEYYALNGLVATLGHMDAFRAEKQSMNLGDIQTLGIVPNLYRQSTVGHSENLAHLRERYGKLVWPGLPMRIAWSDATLQRRPVWNVEPDSAAAKEAWALIERVVARAKIEA